MDACDTPGARLQRLEGYLAQDPRNPALLAETCAAALAAADTRRAAALVEMGGELGAATHDGLQCLFLRALHQAGRVAEAAAWVEAQRTAGKLRACASAVASLVAIDADDFAAAKTLADAALAAGEPGPEALVARAYVAIAEQDPAAATRLLQRALQQLPEDGRTWSALGLASLQAGEPAQARAHFERALAGMPRHVGTWHGLGWACLVLRDPEAARHAFENAIAVDRNVAESHAGLGLALLLAGRPEEAQRPLAQAERLDRANLTGRFARAWQRGQAQDAAALQALAARLLDRPGFFGGRLAEAVAHQRAKTTAP